MRSKHHSKGEEEDDSDRWAEPAPRDDDSEEDDEFNVLNDPNPAGFIRNVRANSSSVWAEPAPSPPQSPSSPHPPPPPYSPHPSHTHDPLHTHDPPTILGHHRHTTHSPGTPHNHTNTNTNIHNISLSPIPNNTHMNVTQLDVTHNLNDTIYTQPTHILNDNLHTHFE